MTKFVSNNVFDNGPQHIIDNCDLLVVLEGYPTDYADAATEKGSGGSRLAGVAVDSGDFAIADGDTSGRKITVAAQNGITIAQTGTADHVALLDTVNSEILLVTDYTSKSLTSGNQVNVGSFADEVADPS
jgi:hypothetical protein